MVTAMTDTGRQALVARIEAHFAHGKEPSEDVEAIDQWRIGSTDLLREALDALTASASSGAPVGEARLRERVAAIRARVLNRVKLGFVSATAAETDLAEALVLLDAPAPASAERPSREQIAALPVWRHAIWVVDAQTPRGRYIPAVSRDAVLALYPPEAQPAQETEGSTP